jgi:hypothetical protein
MCRLELVFDGVSGRMRLPADADDEQLIVRPDYDRRKPDSGGPAKTPERRRTERRRRDTIH